MRATALRAIGAPIALETLSAFSLEGEHHLMDGRRGDGEEALDVGFSGRPSEGERVGMNRGQVLALLVGEFLKRGVHAT